MSSPMRRGLTLNCVGIYTAFEGCSRNEFPDEKGIDTYHFNEFVSSVK